MNIEPKDYPMVISLFLQTLLIFISVIILAILLTSFFIVFKILFHLHTTDFKKIYKLLKWKQESETNL